MSSQAGAFLDAVRRPEYTGENRCKACTAVNVAIAAVVSLAIAVVAVELAVVAFVLAIATIYVRGYLVPGTPELTERYLPERLHRLFGEHPAGEPATLDDTVEANRPPPPEELETLQKVRYHRENKVNAEEYLLEAGVIEEDEEEDDIRLTRAFLDRVDAFRADIDAETIDEAAIAPLFDADAADVDRREQDYPEYRVGRRVRKWPSEAALVADLASERAMHEFADDWGAVPLEQRAKIREMFRYFREDCLTCGGPIVYTDDFVESCCGTWEVIAVKCDACDVRYAEIDPSKVTHVPNRHGLTP